MKNKFPTVLCCSVLFMSSALAQEAGLIAHGASRNLRLVAGELVLRLEEEHAVALVALAPVCGHRISGAPCLISTPARAWARRGSSNIQTSLPPPCPRSFGWGRAARPGLPCVRRGP